MPRRILREPVLVFIVAGALLYAVSEFVDSRRLEPVRLTAAARAALIAEYAALSGAPPGAEEIVRLERNYVGEEILYREALALGLHLEDPGVRERLVEQMRLRIAGPLPEPPEEALVDYYASNLSQYETEPSISFEQVFFTDLPPDAVALVAVLRGGGTFDGDPSRYGNRFARYGRSMLRGLYGQAFVAALWEAPLGEWSGPIRSLHGWHFVRPAERQAAARVPWAEAREQVARDYQAAQARDAVARRVEELAERYEVLIER
jgi:hypothetical protein